MQKSVTDRLSAFFEPSQFINRLFSLLIPVLAFALALLVGSILIWLLDADPVEGYRELLNGALGLDSEASVASQVNARSETLTKAIPLMFVGIGICIAFRGGVINIGGEGQMIMGAVIGMATALTIEDWPYMLGNIPLVGNALQIIAIDLDVPRVSIVGTALVVGFIAGALWGGIAGFLKAYFNVNEILSTIMLNQIALSILLYLLNGPMQDPKQQERAGGIARTIRLPDQARLPRFNPFTDYDQISLHSGIILATVLAVIVYIMLWHTVLGYRIRAVGKSQRASRYAGIKVKRQMVYSMFLAGGFAGLAGIVQVLGLRGLLQSETGVDFTGNAGFNGIVAALFGGLHPIGTIFASILFGGLLVGGQKMQRTIGVEASMITALNGIVVMFVVSAQIFILRRKRRRVTPSSDSPKVVSNPNVPDILTKSDSTAEDHDAN